MTDQIEKLDELEHEVLDFIRRREFSRESQEEFSLLSDELSDIAEIWNDFELLDKNQFADAVEQPQQSSLAQNRQSSTGLSLSHYLLSAKETLKSYFIPTTMGLTAAAFCFFVLIPGYYGTPTEYSIGAGDRLTVELDDGTSVILDSGSVATITEGWSQRKAELKKGTAFFTVTKSAEKPFTVISDNTTVTVLGTQFSVYHDSSLTEVVVKEGKVNVKTENNTTTSTGIDETLVRNQKIKVFSNQTSERQNNIDLEKELSWQKGVINFKDETLANIIKRMNHNYKKPIYIGTKDLENTRLSGSFSIDDKEGFIQSLVEIKQIKIKEEERNTVLY